MKLRFLSHMEENDKSPPTRGRGLKPLLPAGWDCYVPVAPHAGAWIETRTQHRQEMSA